MREDRRKQIDDARSQATNHPMIGANLVDPPDCFDPGNPNFMTPHVLCFVRDQDGDVAELSYSPSASPFGNEMWGLTYTLKLDDPIQVKNRPAFSFEEVVELLYGGKNNCVNGGVVP